MRKIVSRQGLGAALAAMVLTAFAQCVSAQNAPPKIAYVSVERVLRDSAPALAAQQKLDSEFKQRSQELDDTRSRIKALYDYFEKNSAVMTESERTRRQKELADQDKDFQRRQREFSEDVNQRKNEELASVLDRANKVIHQIADSEHYDMVFQDAVYFNPRIDITDKAIKALNALPQNAATAASSPSGK